MFCKEIIELFKKIPDALPKPVDYMKKRKTLLTYIGGKQLIEKYISKLPPMKSPRPRKEAQNKEDYIKDILKKLINIGIIVNSKSIGINWSGLSPKIVM